jgi:hypothetical protein
MKHTDVWKFQGYEKMLFTTRVRSHFSVYFPYVSSARQALSLVIVFSDRLCGVMVRVPGYRSRGPGFDSQRYQIFWEVVSLERGPLSLVSITEELLKSYPYTDHGGP